jgi:hypothetical protein
MVSRPNHKALLAELLVVVLFFTLSQIVILQVFTKAEQINRNTQIRNHALIQAENAVETLAVSDDAEQALVALGFVLDGSAYTLTSLEGYRLQAKISYLKQPAGNFITVELKAYQQEKELFTLPVVRYQGVSTP